MCSINGISFKDEALIKKITLSNTFRGPDSTSFYTDEEISFGFNLLAFMNKPELSKQPVISKNRKIVLMFNGEIYNYVRLKKNLEITEDINEANLLIHLYQKYSENMFELIDGMFAIAIYDIEKKKLVISRDSLGIKPLYYVLKNQRLYFSSDLNSLFNIDFVSKKINLNSLKKYLTYGVNFGKPSMYENIDKVDPCEIIIFDLYKKKLEHKYFNQYKEEPYNDITDSLEESVLNTLSSKRKPCLLISGGIDSNIIYSISKLNQIGLTTLSTIFETKEESANADALIARKNVDKSNHIELNINFNTYLDLIETSPSKLHEPKYNKNQEMYNYVFGHMAKNNIKLALTGDGADELFSGYKMHLLNYFFNYKKFFKYENLKYLIELLGKKKFLKMFFKSDVYDVFNATYSNYEVDDKILSELKKLLCQYSINNKDEYSNFTILELYTIVLEDFLMTKDNFGMAYSIEARFPFLNSFRKHAIQMSPKKKIDPQKNIFKIFLRDNFKNILPINVLDKKIKTGFSIPNEWRINSKYQTKIQNILSNTYLDDFDDFFRESFGSLSPYLIRKKISSNIVHFKTWAKSHNAFL